MRKPKRRTLVVSGVALAALLLVVVLPGFLASQPGFFARYPSLESKHGPWATSTHSEAGCQECHVRPALLSRAAYHARMTGEFYRSLVTRRSAPDAFPKPTNAACLSCHDDLRTVSPKGDLQIPHKAHVNVLKMDCVACHDYLVHEKNAAGKHTPSMEGCLECHDGDTAKNACTACHTDKAAPDTHKAADWTVVHSDAAAKPGAECAECHAWTDKWCADCHARRPASHTKDWRAAHGEQVKNRRTCEACHAAAFCVRCHGEVPKLNFDPALKVVQ